MTITTTQSSTSTQFIHNERERDDGVMMCDGLRRREFDSFNHISQREREREEEIDLSDEEEG